MRYRDLVHSNPNEPTFVFDGLPLHWQLTRCEKFAFAALLDHARPEVALEIGTYKGGSLQLMASKAKKVYSLDISPNPQAELSSSFENVEFIVGDSLRALPKLLDDIHASHEKLGFVLIDGSHTTEGVRADINHLLKYIPQCPLYLVMHDSFNPDCRKGILTADWLDCPYVHFVEIDFIPGVFHYLPFDTAPARSMFGGIAMGLLLPEPRQHELVLHQSQKGLFDTVLTHSCHSSKSVSFPTSLINSLRKRIHG